MDNKKSLYIFIGFMALVVILAAIYLISFFGGKGESKQSNRLGAFLEDKGTFKSKIEAYEKLENDSILSVREENFRTDLSQVFGKKKKTEEKELIPDEKNNEVVVKPEKQIQLETRVPKIPKTSIIKIKPNNYTSRIEKASSEKSPDVKSNAVMDPGIRKQSNPKTSEPRRRNAFNSFSQDNSTTDKSTVNQKNSSLQAVVHSQQEVYTGATVKLRTTREVVIAGNTIPANTIIYGAVSLNNERVGITVTSIPVNGTIVSVELSAYDKDGIEGIYIPGLAVHQARTETVDQAISEAQTRMKVPYVSGAVNVVRNRNRLSTAILTDNYSIILK